MYTKGWGRGGTFTMMVPAAFCIAGDMISAIGGVVAVRIARTQYEEHGLLEFSSSPHARSPRPIKLCLF